MKFGMQPPGFLCGLLLVSCSGNKLPRIINPETLRKDCTTLYQQFPNEVRTNGSGHEFVVQGGFVPKEKWTPAIIALKPFQVTKNKYGIRIWIRNSKEEIEGYYVFLIRRCLHLPCRFLIGDEHPAKTNCISKEQT
jgi:hypothetical protein